MDHELLANLAKVPGVIACAAFDAEGTCLAEVLPPPFERSILEAALDSVDRGIAALRADGSASGASLVVLAGAHGQLAVRFIEETGLIAVVQPTINMAMLSVAMNVVAARLGDNETAPRMRGPSIDRGPSATDAASTSDDGAEPSKKSPTKDTLKVLYTELEDEAKSKQAAASFAGGRFDGSNGASEAEGESEDDDEENDDEEAESVYDEVTAIGPAPQAPVPEDADIDDVGSVYDEVTAIGPAPLSSESAGSQETAALQEPNNDALPEEEESEESDEGESIASAPEDVVPTHVLTTLVNAICYVIGPAGLYVVRRTLHDWGVPPASLSRARYPELLDALARRIPDDEKRRDFVQRGHQICQ